MASHNIASIARWREYGWTTGNMSKILREKYSTHQETINWYVREETSAKRQKELQLISHPEHSDKQSSYKQVIKELTSLNLIRSVCMEIWIAPAQYTQEHHELKHTEEEHLESMTPERFLTYLTSELSIDDRESLMIFEKYRLKTFSVSWPHTSDSLVGAKMAATGFYNVDDGDRVMCVFCRGSIHRWIPGDSPSDEHRSAFSFCPFLQGRECGNVPINSESPDDTVSERNREETERNIAINTEHEKPNEEIEIKTQLTGALAELQQEPQQRVNIDENVDIQITPNRMENKSNTDNSSHFETIVRRNSIPTHDESPVSCLICPERNQSVSPASHIGLPCGDLILCGECNQLEVEKKTANPDYQCLCPSCGKCLAGTLHVLFA